MPINLENYTELYQYLREWLDMAAEADDGAEGKNWAMNQKKQHDNDHSDQETEL